MLRNHLISLVIIVCGFVCIPAESTWAQLRAIRIGGVGIQDDNDLDITASGASLKTDPELEAILEKADRYREDGNYRVASQLWQAVLERSGDTLFSTDQQTYWSLVEQVEKTIASLPPEGLETYRISADANAKAIIAASQGTDDVAALNQVVRQFFLSSHGDDAAYRLAQVYLDRYDFIGARRMLTKIMETHPDPSIPLDQIYLRIALCEAFLGEVDAAEQSLTESERLAADAETDQRYAWVRGSMGNLSPEWSATQSGNWAMPYGNAKRFGVMPTVSPAMMESDLVAKWQYYFEPRDRYKNASDGEGKVLVGTDSARGAAQATANQSELQIQQRWRQKEWRPAGHLLIQSEQLFFKSAADLLTWQLPDIEAAVASNDANQSPPYWRSLWQNSFRIDDATSLLRALRGNYSSYSRRRGIDMTDNLPASNAEMQLFGDPIYQQMSIHGDLLYTIECEAFDQLNSNAPKQKRQAPWNATIRRSRENHLVAYDWKSGKPIWKLPHQTTGKDGEEVVDDRWLSSGGFMSAPLQYGDALIAAVNQGGAISAYAFDRREGYTLWKAFLCDEPESSAPSNSPINMSIDGSDLFISCGVGVIFVLDPATGMIRFAKRYERTGKADPTFQRMNWTNPRTIFEGWSEDVIIPYGRQMICFCSDSNMIYAYDRNSGETIWYMSRQTHYGLNVDYLLGVYDGILYAGGRQTIIAIDLQTEGSLLWGGDNLFGEKISFGRGMLTEQGIFMPVGNSIYQFALKSEQFEPKLLSKVNVDLGTDSPVGNLHSDGKRIWVHGANRLYGLWADDLDDNDKSSPVPAPQRP